MQKPSHLPGHQWPSVCDEFQMRTLCGVLDKNIRCDPSPTQALHSTSNQFPSSLVPAVSKKGAESLNHSSAAFAARGSDKQRNNSPAQKVVTADKQSRRVRYGSGPAGRASAVCGPRLHLETLCHSLLFEQRMSEESHNTEASCTHRRILFLTFCLQTDSVAQRGWIKSQNRTPEKGRGGRRRDKCRQETGAGGAGPHPRW